VTLNLLICPRCDDLVQPARGTIRLHRLDGSRRAVVLVCPHCSTRLLPTRREIQETRGAA
jgi:RNase P subunit RPR2